MYVCNENERNRSTSRCTVLTDVYDIKCRESSLLRMFQNRSRGTLMSNTAQRRTKSHSRKVDCPPVH